MERPTLRLAEDTKRGGVQPRSVLPRPILKRRAAPLRLADNRERSGRGEQPEGDLLPAAPQDGFTHHSGKFGQPTIGEHIEKTFGGGAKLSASGVTNTLGTVQEVSGVMNRRGLTLDRQEKQRELEQYLQRADHADDDAERDYFLWEAQRARRGIDWTEDAYERSKTAGQAMHQKADELADSAAADISRAKEGLNAVGQFAVDLGVAGTQMGLDALAALTTGFDALPIMAVRSFGASTQEARREGASLGQQLAYGVGSAAISTATEKISNIAKPFAKLYGKGLLETVVPGVVQDLTKSMAGRIALSAITEGFEEFFEEALQPLLKRATYDEDARLDLQGALYVGIIGAAMGAITGAFSPAWKAEQEMQEGVVKPQDSDTIKTIEVSLPKNRAQIMHIFRADDGHLTDTPENRTRLLQLAQDSQYRLGVDIHGNIWHAKLLEDGSQLWVEYRDGVIREGGLNLIPHEWDDETGLNNNPKKNGTWRKKEKS